MSVDFPLILVILVFGSGIIWLLDALLFAPKRRQARNALQAKFPAWAQEGSRDAVAYDAK